MPRLFAAVVCLLVLAVPASAQADVTVFAAASLSHALKEVSAGYEKKRGVKVRHSFASSATLAKQIDSGAPADVFISANTKWMDYLQARGRIDASSRKDLLRNRLVLVVPRGKGFAVSFDKTFDLSAAFEGRLCTGNVESVPAGIYAKQALTSLGWWKKLDPRIVGAGDVRAALVFVERGECAAGIVYESDARISDKVEVVGMFPHRSHEPIVYPIALVTNEGNRSEDYMEYLLSPASRAILAKHGFGMVK